jgi:hypothetical protein
MKKWSKKQIDFIKTEICKHYTIRRDTLDRMEFSAVVDDYVEFRDEYYVYVVDVNKQRKPRLRNGRPIVRIIGL